KCPPYKGEFRNLWACDRIAVGPRCESPFAHKTGSRSQTHRKRRANVEKRAAATLIHQKGEGGEEGLPVADSSGKGLLRLSVELMIAFLALDKHSSLSHTIRNVLFVTILS